MQHPGRNEMCGTRAKGVSLAVLGVCSLEHLPGYTVGEQRLDNCFDIKFWKQAECTDTPLLSD